jgi:lysophospholipase L1-like esterase
MRVSRRSFLQQTAMATTAVAVPSILNAAFPGNGTQKLLNVRKECKVLFQGDSITDAGRDKTREVHNTGFAFGTGYAYLAASAILQKYAEQKPLIYNRGISGNKVFQLAERWQKDCLDLKPDILSILIGVNDYWHMRNGQYNGTVEVYEKDFRQLLKTTQESIPDIKFVICQPFALTGTTAVDESWKAPLAGYQASAEKLCIEFNAIWVPFQKIFDEALHVAPATWWAPDGVHPSMAGAYLMASAWLRATFGITM